MDELQTLKYSKIDMDFKNVSYFATQYMNGQAEI